MSNTQETDQITYSYLFIITPLDIISTKNIKNLKKSILLKLGNKTEKTSQLNKPIQMPVDVLYSKTLKKYCPIKGIIKVYDINLDGSQVISSVGGFQTQQILNQNKNNVIIERDIGTSKIKMKIQIKNLGSVPGKTQNVNLNKNMNAQKQIIAKKQQYKYPLSRSRTRQNTPQVESNNLQKSRQSISNVQKQQNVQTQSKKDTGYQYFKRTSPVTSNGLVQTPPKLVQIKKKTSLQYIKSDNKVGNINMYKKSSQKQQSNKQSKSQKESQSGSFTSSYLRQKQNQQLQQLLSQQRKNIVCLQQKLVKYHKKVQKLKNRIQQNNKQKQQIINHFTKITNGLDTKNGKVWIQTNDKQKMLNIKYKQRFFDKTFISFVEFMIFKASKHTNNNHYYQQQDEQHNQINFINKLNAQTTNQIKNLNQQLSRKTNQIFSLRAKQREKGSLQIKLKSKQRQCLQLQNRIKQIQILKKTLKQQNNYLKQKDQTMQQIITEKENQIEILKQQITQIQLQYKQLQSNVKNDACEIQQLKEEVSNLNQIIDGYREKYGDLKNTKNRALQNQLKQCLIWIDQQTRQLQMSDFVQQTEPSHSHNVSQIIKNIQLQGASRQQMNSIKVQLAGLIKRIDNFLAK